jgi:hypothetical protein
MLGAVGGAAQRRACLRLCRYEEDQAVLRTLRMALRDLTLQLLGSRRWELFWEPEPADSDWWDKVGGGGSGGGSPGRSAGGLCACTLLCPALPSAGCRCAVSRVPVSSERNLPALCQPPPPPPPTHAHTGERAR